MDGETIMHEKLVYIIVLNWNGRADTEECVRSCQKATYPRFRILIVDNGSSDGSEEFLRGRFGDVEFLQTGANLGFAGGNNRGIEYALARGAEYIWLLNNDTVVAPEALTELVRVFEANGRAGIVGSKIYYHDDPDRVWFAGGWINYRRGSTGHTGEGEKDDGQFAEVREVDYITGCSLMISREAIAAVGLMDERYFLLFEEVDWNERVKASGYKVLLAPGSRVWHRISRSLGEHSAMYYYYLYRNCLLFTAKQRPLLLPCVFPRKFLEALNFYRLGKPSAARLALLGIADFFTGRLGICRRGPAGSEAERQR